MRISDWSSDVCSSDLGAVKIARKYFASKGQPEKWRIITFEGCFHGRTLAMLAATNNKKYLEGFGEKVNGFDQVSLDMGALKAAITGETAAVMIEPIQGDRKSTRLNSSH